jgi:hypothetical protein
MSLGLAIALIGLIASLAFIVGIAVGDCYDFSTNHWYGTGIPRAKDISHKPIIPVQRNTPIKFRLTVKYYTYLEIDAIDATDERFTELTNTAFDLEDNLNALLEPLGFSKVWGTGIVEPANGPE